MDVITIDEKARLESKLAELRSNRPKITERIAEARALGDLKENAEYHTAREQQGYEEAEITRLEKRLKEAQVIDENSPHAEGVVFLGSMVKLRDLSDDDEDMYRLVGEATGDLSLDYVEVTVTSPMGEALMKASVGETAEQCGAGGGDSDGRRGDGVALQGLLGPCIGLFVAAGDEVRQRHAGVHGEHQHVDRTVAYGALQLVDREFRFAQPASDEAALDQRRGCVGIEQQGLVKQGSAPLVLAEQARRGKAGRSQGEKVVASDLVDPIAQATHFGNFGIGGPTHHAAQGKAGQRQTIGRGIVGIERDGAIGELQGLVEAVPAPGMEKPHRLHVGEMRIDRLRGSRARGGGRQPEDPARLSAGALRAHADPRPARPS